MSHGSTAAALPGLVPTAVQEKARVVEQVRLARDTYRLRLSCPQIAQQIRPGQFFMIHSPGRSDPLLGRPFALFDVYEDPNGQPAGVDLGYLVVGKMTSLMSGWHSGDEVDIWGPLGNGFPVPQGEHLMLVAGGIGQTPFLAVAREALGLRTYGNPPRQVEQRPRRVTLCYGARSADCLAGLPAFDIDGLDVQIATDDGTQGHHGFVSDLLVKAIESDDPPDSVYCCGPEPMMRAVQEITGRANIPCWLSLETPMACGCGICFSCVVKVLIDDGSWDYRRACVEGPVFPADRVVL